MATHVMNLTASNYAATQKEYTARLEQDSIENWNFGRIDAFIGFLTTSFVETFFVSGAIAGHVGQGDVPGGEFYGGLRYNPQGNRTITKVIGIQRMSGSGGVTVVDVQITGSNAGGLPTANESIFSNEVYKLIMSASEIADGVPTEVSTFAAGSGTWAAGMNLGIVVESATDGPCDDLTVQVHWKPAASYT